MANSRGRFVIPVTIASGQSLSNEVSVDDLRIVGIMMPAGWDAAGISFVALTRQSSGNPPVATFGKVQDYAGTEVTITTPAADTYVAIDDSRSLQALGRIKVRSGVAATPVNQTADRVLYLVAVES